MRLLALVSKAPGLSPGQRFRLEQWAPRLERDHGIQLDFVAFESPELTELLHKPGRRIAKALRVSYDFFRRAGAIRQSRHYDGVVVFREAALIGPAIYERVLAGLRKPIFFDFDDAIWHPSQTSRANGVFSKLHFYGKTKTNCRKASAVFAGNEYLAAYSRKFNRNVFVIPTSIELDRYPIQPEAGEDDGFIVSWSGSLSTLAHFEHARSALERLASRRRTTVKVICNEPPSRTITGAHNIFVPWQEANEAETLGACHVGIMPLPDNEFTRGKCGLKALQYMAVQRPVVISPVGMNRDLVRTGENGYLADTEEEWLAAFEALAASAEHRALIGAAGRKTVEDHFSAGVVSERVARAIRQTLASAS